MCPAKGSYWSASVDCVVDSKIEHIEPFVTSQGNQRFD